MRVSASQGGASGSSSQDFVRLAGILFERSAIQAKGIDGNCSVFALAGIPALFSALRCLLIELNAGTWSGRGGDAQTMQALANSANDVQFILKHYAVSVELNERLSLLYEVRNEIVHPAHRASGERNNTPAYLAPLRDVGLLQSTGTDTDYIWIAQLQSHALFRWAFATIQSVVDVLLNAHQVAPLTAVGLRESYARYAVHDL